MNLGTRNKIKVEAGTASMTDLVFLLLIFFIIISLTASNNHTPVDLPKPSENLSPVQDPVTTTIVITEENKYFLSQTEKLEDARDFDLIKEKISKEVNDSGKLKDASFLRGRNLMLSYAFKPELIQRLNLNRLNIFMED